MTANTILVRSKRSLVPCALLFTCLLQACAQDSDKVSEPTAQSATPVTNEQVTSPAPQTATPVAIEPVTSSPPQTAAAVGNEFIPLREGLLEFSEPNNRYSEAAYNASMAYQGKVELATVDISNAGLFATTLLMGPLSSANTPNSVPLNTDHYGVEGALFPGWPIAILSRTGLGFPLVQPRSLGTSRYDSYLESQQKLQFQLPWWDVFSNVNGGQLACLGGGTVTWSSNLLVNTLEDGDERSITWDDCQVQTTAGPFSFGNSTTITTDGVWLDGKARIHQQAVNGYAIAWDDVQYQADGRQWRISGVETSNGAQGCGFDQQRVSNLLIESIDSGHTVLLENFRSGIVGEPPESSVCAASGLFNNWYEGRVLHSERGAVDISTPIHLNYVSPSPTIDKLVEWPAADPNDANKTLGGTLLIQGLNGSQLRVAPTTFRRFGDIHTAEYVLPEKDAIAITLTYADGVSDSFHFERSDSLGIQHGITADLLDSDSDGLPNAWELVFNLDPADALDGSQDFDNDGLSNVEEFQQMTHPYLADQTNVDTDTALTIEQYNSGQSSSGDRQLIYISLSALNVGDGFRRTQLPLELTLHGDARFDQVRDAPYLETVDCISGENDQTLICELAETKYCDWNGCQYNGIHAYITVEVFSDADADADAVADAPVILEAAIESGSADPNPDNDSATLLLQW